MMSTDRMTDMMNRVRMAKMMGTKMTGTDRENK